MEQTPPSRRNLDDVVKKLSELNDNTLRMKAAVEQQNLRKSIVDLAYENIPSATSEKVNTDRTIKQAEEIEKNTAKGARAKAIDDRVQTEMDIKETNKNRDKIAEQNLKKLDKIAGDDQTVQKTLNDNMKGVANDNAEGIMESNTKSSEATIKARMEAKAAEKTLLEILEKQAYEAQEKRETELEAQIENGNLTGQQLEILSLIHI